MTAFMGLGRIHEDIIELEASAEVFLALDKEHTQGFCSHNALRIAEDSWED